MHEEPGSTSLRAADASIQVVKRSGARMTEQFVTLDEGQLERLAELVAVKFGALPFHEEQLVEVGTVARYLGVDPAWVYAHADELGARRLGSGARPRLRFSLQEVSARLT